MQIACNEDTDYESWNVGHDKENSRKENHEKVVGIEAWSNEVQLGCLNPNFLKVSPYHTGRVQNKLPGLAVKNELNWLSATSECLT